MSKLTRRTVLKGAAGAAVAASSIGFPRILEAADTIKVGVLVPLSGLEAILGEVMNNCFVLAIEQINAAGGIGGRQIEAITEDNQTSAPGTIDKCRKLVFQDKVSVIMGLVASLERKAAMSVTDQAKMPLIYPTYYEGGECSKYLVCTGQLPNQQITPNIPWITKNIGKSVYIIGSDYVWPRISAKSIVASIEAQGGKVVAEEYFPFGVQDLGPVLGRIKDAKPDMCWMMLAGADFVTGVKQYRSFGLKPRLVSQGMDELFIGALPNEAFAEVITNQAYFMALDNPTNKKFVEAFHARHGKDKVVDAIGEASYDAVWLYKAAVEKAGSVEADKVIPAISQVKFDAPQGTVDIAAANNHMRCNSILANTKADGTFEVIQNFGQIDPDVPGCKLG